MHPRTLLHLGLALLAGAACSPDSQPTAPEVPAAGLTIFAGVSGASTDPSLTVRYRER